MSPEDAPLLHVSDRQPVPRGKHQRKRIANPLPWRQFSLVLFIKACDALASESMYPYINEVESQVLFDIVYFLQCFLAY
jgi:hypothetical protein